MNVDHIIRINRSDQKTSFIFTMLNHGQSIDVSCPKGRCSGRNCNEKARKRWLLLAHALLKDKENVCHGRITESQVSVRRFHDFGLFSIVPLSNCEATGSLTSWFDYSTHVNDKTYSVEVRHIVKLLTPADLMGFNNTGNICVWPSEEVLAYYCLSNGDLFHEKSILELGGGMTCLAGVMLAKFGMPQRVLLTDGNSESIGNVRAIVAANQLPESLVQASVLNWNCDSASLRGKFDVVLAADCLFFEETRKDLVTTIWNCLKENAVALVVAPARGQTHTKFIKVAQSVGFVAKLHGQNYNIDIYNRHLCLKSSNSIYEEDIHYPLLISLFKPSSAES